MKIVRRLAKTERGFTLIELLVVITILGALAGIGVFLYSGFDSVDASGTVDDYNSQLCTAAQAMADAINEINGDEALSASDFVDGDLCD